MCFITINKINFKFKLHLQKKLFNLNLYQQFKIILEDQLMIN